jgi:hypothetical protein
VPRLLDAGVPWTVPCGESRVTRRSGRLNAGLDAAFPSQEAPPKTRLKSPNVNSFPIYSGCSIIMEYDPDVLDSLIELAVEVAREGREGRRVGTLITFGDENAVLARSRPLILDPLSGHPKSSLHVTNLSLRGTIKELAQLDGGFVVSGEGIFLSAPLPRCCSSTSGGAAGTRQPSHCRCQHECCHQGGGYCGFREFGGETFLSWTTGRRNYSRDLDDGSCPPGWHR